MKQLQLISGFVFMVFGALICFESRDLSFGTPGQPGPGFFPLGLGIILFCLALIFILKTALKWEGMSHSARTLWTGLRWKQVPYILASLLAYALLLDRLGYFICTWILMTYFFWGKGKKRKGVAVLGAIIVTIATFILFRTLLRVRLPLGILRL